MGTTSPPLGAAAGAGDLVLHPVDEVEPERLHGRPDGDQRHHRERRAGEPLSGGEPGLTGASRCQPGREPQGHGVPPSSLAHRPARPPKTMDGSGAATNNSSTGASTATIGTM